MDKGDFRKGDFILFEFSEGEYIRGQIIEIKDNFAVIEIVIPGAKSFEELEREIISVEYDEIIHFDGKIEDRNIWKKNK